MKYLAFNLKKHPQFLKLGFFFSILILIFSLILFNKLDNTLISEEIKNFSSYLTNSHLNFFIIHFLIISLILTCSLTIIGLIFIPIYLFFEGLSIFYNIYIFKTVYGLSGFFFGLIFNILTKLIYLILLIYIIKKIINIFKTILKYNLNKSNIDLKYSLTKNIKTIIICIFIIIINDLFIYFFAHNILLKFTFLLK